MFRQPAERGLKSFEQYWWYINPSDTKKDSRMLTFEIKETRDRSDLDEIFATLKKSASKTSGQDVYNHRDKLSAWIEGKQ